MVQPSTSLPSCQVPIQPKKCVHYKCTIKQRPKLSESEKGTLWIWTAKCIFGHIIFNFLNVLLLKIMRNCVYAHYPGGQNSSATSAFSRVELESKWIEVWLAVNYSLSWSLMPSTPLAAVSSSPLKVHFPKPFPLHTCFGPTHPPSPPNLDNPSLSPAPSSSCLHPPNCKADPDDMKETILNLSSIWDCLTIIAMFFKGWLITWRQLRITSRNTGIRWSKIYYSNFTTNLS